MIFTSIALFGPSDEEWEAAKREARRKRDSADVAQRIHDSVEKAVALAAYEALPQSAKDSIKRAERAEERRRDSAYKAQVAESKRAEMVTNPEKYLTVKSWEWQRGGFGAIGIINVTFKNAGVKTASDIVVKVTFNGESGTALDEKIERITTVVPPGKSKTASDINLGFIDSQAKGASIEILSATFN